MPCKLVRHALIRGSNGLKLGRQNRALFYIDNIGWNPLCEIPFAAFYPTDNLDLPRTTPITPGRTGDDVIHLVFHQTRQRRAFAALLQSNADMLLLATTADAKMRTARRFSFWAII
ncbi:Uncharacterised protein [Salmonella enterica subsp. arizonae]|uniref:Uncharacterized protein n=1 Tax=Salmonella enterica subsp. arizonae TaxID=59203 RepID=A0A2X4W400_SALER|nr:Uncharacterised protein [Salmonella enterica subsp. arizonae]